MNRLSKRRQCILTSEVADDRLMDMSKRQTIADALRQAIAADERTEYRLAKDADLSQGVLSRFTAGERDLRLGTADKLCQALGLELKQTRKAGA